MNKIYLPDRVLSSIAVKHFHSTILLLLAFLTMTVTHAQVNTYARVTNIDAAKRVLTISNLNPGNGSFPPGRQVIVLQMQDNVIGNTGNNAGFGSLSNIGSAGFFEVATVQSLTGNQMTLMGPLQHNYPTTNNSRVQVVSFNQLGNPDFTTTENINAVPWNGNTGGVIAFQVPGTLTLRHSIIADEAGFRGGNESDNDRLECQSSMYITGSNNYGEKGEGIYRNTNGDQSRGRGKLLTGGGGGNGFNAGGAGGGNYSGGGDGGPGFFCNDETGGLGGIALNTYLMTGTRVFMGGGGGGGQGDDDDQTEGGNGGGIIIIKARTITTGFGTERISANGASSRNTIRDGNDGAGGAGAGGTILLQVNNYNVTSGRLNIQANGGDGGNVASIFQHGGGGGGGQGAILFSGAPPSNNVSYHTFNGTGGLNFFFFGASRAGNGTGENDAGIVTDIGIGLPVRLISFTAGKDDTKTRLNWTATDEENTVFHVQHSTDGAHYTEIGVVRGTGRQEAITNYSFTHVVPAPGVNFYRLEMKEEPSYIRYSSVASVNFSDLPATPLAWPNPARDHFSIRLTGIGNNTRYAVSITNLAGKLMYSSAVQPVNNIITVNTGNTLQPGVYIVKVHTGNTDHFVKLIIQ